MRKPTPDSQLYLWHHQALKGDKPLITDEPQCGWYQRKLVRGGPMVPAVIWVKQDIDDDTGELLEQEEYCCQLGDNMVDPHEQWTWLAANPISQARYNHMQRYREWCWHHDPDDPVNRPHRKYNWSTLKPDF